MQHRQSLAQRRLKRLGCAELNEGDDHAIDAVVLRTRCHLTMVNRLDKSQAVLWGRVNDGSIAHSIQFDMFHDRNEAALALAVQLQNFRGKNPLVIAIPRGAVPMGKIIAHELNGELDVVLVRKLRAPNQPELAIGSVDEGGWTYIADHAGAYGASQQYIAAEKQRQLETIHQRRVQYTPVRPPIDPAGRIVIVVDDGLATGATMIAALQGLRTRHPAQLICAVPVAPPDTLKRVAELADQVICLEAPEYFQAVGQFYAHFPQVEDDEVIALLRAGRA